MQCMSVCGYVSSQGGVPPDGPSPDGKPGVDGVPGTDGTPSTDGTPAGPAGAPLLPPSDSVQPSPPEDAQPPSQFPASAVTPDQGSLLCLSFVPFARVFRPLEAEIEPNLACQLSRHLPSIQSHINQGKWCQIYVILSGHWLLLMIYALTVALQGGLLCACAPMSCAGTTVHCGNTTGTQVWCHTIFNKNYATCNYSV